MFYNIYGDEISQESILEDLISYYQELHDAGKTEITDFSEGSEVRTLLEVLSHLAYNIREEQNDTIANHFINTANDEYLDLLGANPNVTLQRIEGNAASGFVKFSINTPATSEVTIPTDTSVNSDEQEYITTEEGIINIGENYTYVPVECVIEGADGNCEIGDINNCDDFPEITITNDEAFTNGIDEEDDEDYRNRMLNFVRADNFGSRGYYENILLSFDGVHDIKVFDSSDTICYYLNTNTSSGNVKALTEAITYFNDNNNCQLGHSFDLRPSILYLLMFDVHLPSNSEVTSREIESLIKSIFTGGESEYYPISYDGLDMGETKTKAELITLIQEVYPELTNITIDGITINGNEASEIAFPDDNDYNAFHLFGFGVEFDL